ncbi:MAG: type II toxin-antitoxin system VapC family toxin [Rhodocyclaceae bacterium]
MVAFVVDNSIAVAWVYPKQATEYTEKLLELSGSGTLHTAFIWPAEFTNTASVMVNRGLLSDDLGREMISMIKSFGFVVDRDPADPCKLYQLSQEYRLSAYDASYLELAIRMEIPLATRDAELANAAKKLNLYLS